MQTVVLAQSVSRPGAVPELEYAEPVRPAAAALVEVAAARVGARVAVRVRAVALVAVGADAQHRPETRESELQ